jgi:hypothetical protein
VTGYHYVRPHTRSNGSYVRGHVQRNPSRTSAGAVLPIILLILLLILLAAYHSAAAHRPTVHSVKTPTHSQATVQTIRNDRTPVPQRR